MATRIREASPAPDDEHRLPMTYEQWLDWAGESTQSEWVDGEAISFPPPKTVHALLVTFLTNLLSLDVDLLGLGRVIAAPFEMRLVRSAREPDLLFIAAANLGKSTPDRFLGGADFVVELISDHSVGRDRVAERAEYEAAGIREYWLFDPRPAGQRADFFLLGADGCYAPAALDPNGRFHSRNLPGFWLRLAWLWQDPLPTPLALMIEIAPTALRTAVGGVSSVPDPSGA